MNWSSPLNWLYWLLNFLLQMFAIWRVSIENNSSFLKLPYKNICPTTITIHKYFPRQNINVAMWSILFLIVFLKPIFNFVIVDKFLYNLQRCPGQPAHVMQQQQQDLPLSSGNSANNSKAMYSPSFYKTPYQDFSVSQAHRMSGKCHVKFRKITCSNENFAFKKDTSALNHSL